MTVAPPPVPADAPADVQEFFACRSERLELAGGAFSWLPLPPVVHRLAGEQLLPEVVATPTGRDAARLRIGWGPVGMSMDVRLVDGRLAVSFPNRWNVVASTMRDPIEGWVDHANEWLEANGRHLSGLTVVDGVAVVTKSRRAEP